MTAPDEGTLRRFLLGQLSAAEAGTVEAFIETHPEKSAVLDRLSAADPFVSAFRGRTGEPAVPAEAETLARRLEGLPAEQTRSAGGDSSADFSRRRTEEDVAAVLAPPQGSDELGRLGDFRVLRVLGRGGMGVVFEAEDTRLGRRVAVKAMLPKIAADPLAKQRFLREAKAAAAVEHDHVVPIHHIEEANGVPFLVMPFLKGESLDDRLKRVGTLPIAEVVRIGREVAEGLSAAHARGLVHRDIKPANLWLEAPKDRVRILDFGLARPAETGPGAELTQSGAIVGTPAYMSPEQGRGQAVDFRTDLFSLGGVLYRVATGRTPFQGNDPAAMLMSLAADTPIDPRRLNPRVPGPLAALILQLLEKDPAHRPASAREVARALSPAVEALPAGGDGGRPEFAFDEDETEVVPVAKPVSKRGRVGLRIGVAVGVLALGVVLLFAPTIIRIATNKGELVVEVDDPNIEVVVKGADAEVHDKSRGRRYVLTAGDGQVEFLDPVTGARAFTKTFHISRGGRTPLRATMAEIVAARPKPKAVPAAGAAPEPARPIFPESYVAGGNWRMEGDELVQATPGKAMLMFGDPAWTDYDVTVETKTAPGGEKGPGAFLYFRATAPDNYMNFNLGAYDGNLDELAYLRDGKWGRDVEPRRGPYRPDQWFRMQVEVRGKHVRCRLDGKLVFETDNDQFPAGRIGLGTWSKAIRWRNLKVTAPDGKVLYAGFPKLPPASSNRFTNGLGMEFALVPKGKAWLGGGGGKPGEREVEFEDDFYLGVYPVTQEEWQKVTGQNPSRFSRAGDGRQAVKDIADADLKHFPVESVSWDDCQLFLAKLNEQAKETGWVYRLPTEAEWEYACRGGPVDRVNSGFDYYVGTPGTELRAGQANFGKGEAGTPCRVDAFAANRLGLHDLHGNVHQWCADKVAGPGQAAGDSHRVLRGGSYWSPAWACRAASRFVHEPTYKHGNVGLRVVRVRAATPAGPTADQRQALEAVLAAGGRLALIVDNKKTGLGPGDGLPGGPFAVETVNLGPAKNLTPAIVEHLRATPPVSYCLILPSSVDDEILARLVACPGLTTSQVVLLGGSGVTDAGCEHFRKFGKLFQLDLARTRVSAAGLAPVRDTRVEFLNLDGCPRVDDEAAAVIATLPNLRSAALPKTAVTAKGVEALGKCPTLEALTLGGDRADDALLAAARHLKGLVDLQFVDARLTDAGLAKVKEFPALARLNVERNKGIMDAGLEHLAGCKRLTWVRLGGTGVTKAGVEKLAAALPGCRINYDGGTVGPKE